MSRLYSYKDQVDKVYYPTGKIILVLIRNTTYDACLPTMIPETIPDYEKGIIAPTYDCYGNGKGKDYYGNDCK